MGAQGPDEREQKGGEGRTPRGWALPGVRPHSRTSLRDASLIPYRTVPYANGAARHRPSGTSIARSPQRTGARKPRPGVSRNASLRLSFVDHAQC